MKIRTKDTFGCEKEYEVAEKIQTGFFVWNIGKNMGSDEYIPICEYLHPGNENDYSINPDTVKAIKLCCDEVDKLRKAASYGVNSLETAQKALRSKRKGPVSDRKRALAKLTIDIFEKITA